MLDGVDSGASGLLYGANLSSASSSNPVSALIAGRATLLAPPSLSTVNHSDTSSAPSEVNSALLSCSRDTLSQNAQKQRSEFHVQQALSPATAATPVSTHENISISNPLMSHQTWGLVQHQTEALNTSSRSSDPPFDFTVHPCFRKDAEYQGNVLVRVEDVEFFVHKHVLLFSSPFFASLLDGDWKESCLPRISSASSVKQTAPSLRDDQRPHSEARLKLEIRSSDCHHDNMSTPRVSDCHHFESNVSAFSQEEHASPGDCNSTHKEPLSRSKTGMSWSAKNAQLHSIHAPSADVGRQVNAIVGSNAQDFRPTSLNLDHSHCQLEVASSPANNLKQSVCLNNTTLSSAALRSVNDVGGVDAHTPLDRLSSLATPPGSPLPSSGTRSGHDEVQNIFEAPLGSKQQTSSSLSNKVVAIVDLEEESAMTFHDFLFHIYPHLDLSVTWRNCGPLLRFADKFQVPYLRRSCVAFLRAALAGRPIQAMQLAESHGMDDLYREASRHVLDNFAAWKAEELDCLSASTLLKLERKRTWFLERLLKLGLANPARDYECQSNCPDPQTCARTLHEKWQSAYANAFRFSPPQPSVVFRHLRELDNSIYAFLPFSACQNTARTWVQGLFDRMFSLSTLHAPRQFVSIKLTDPPCQKSQ